MKNRHTRTLAWVLVAAAGIFLFYALNHPEGSFPWGNGVTYVLYGLFFAVVAYLFAAPPRKKR